MTSMTGVRGERGFALVMAMLVMFVLGLLVALPRHQRDGAAQGRGPRHALLQSLDIAEAGIKRDHVAAEQRRHHARHREPARHGPDLPHHCGQRAGAGRRHDRGRDQAAGGAVAAVQLGDARTGRAHRLVQDRPGADGGLSIRPDRGFSESDGQHGHREPHLRRALDRREGNRQTGHRGGTRVAPVHHQHEGVVRRGQRASTLGQLGMCAATITARTRQSVRESPRAMRTMRARGTCRARGARARSRTMDRRTRPAFRRHSCRSRPPGSTPGRGTPFGMSQAEFFSWIGAPRTALPSTSDGAHLPRQQRRRAGPVGGLRAIKAATARACSMSTATCTSTATSPS